MRIAFYAPRASHLDLDLSRGGDPVFLHALFAGLAERGHEVKIVSRFNVRDLWRGHVPVSRLFTEALAIRREIGRFSPDAWLVYDPSRTYPDLFGWWQRPRRYVLLAAHTWQSNSLPRFWRWPLAFAHRRSLARADKIVAVRPSSAARLISGGVAPERLSVLPPAAVVREQLPSREEARQSLGLPLDAPVIMSVSRFTGPNEASERKTEMVLNLIASIVQLPPKVVLVVVGEGPGRPQVEREIARLELDGRVQLVGGKTHEDVYRYFAACDVYAYPLQLDRPWMSVLEAQACGRPVVTMLTESAELTVDAGRTGLLAKDLDEFRSHLAALVSDPARRDSMGQAAREYVTSFHSVQTRARQIEELLGGSS